MNLLTPDPRLPFFLLFLSGISIVLLIVALIKLIKKGQLAPSAKLFWGLIILFVWLIGPILYLTMGDKKSSKKLMF